MWNVTIPAPFLTLAVRSLLVEVMSSHASPGGEDQPGQSEKGVYDQWGVTVSSAYSAFKGVMDL